MRELPPQPAGLDYRFTNYCLGLILILSALLFGGADPASFAVLQIAIVLLAVATFWHGGMPRYSAAVWAPVAALIAIPLIQLAPLPSGWIAWISPNRFALSTVVRELPDSRQAALTLSVNSFATISALLRLVCYAAVFLLAFRSGRTASIRQSVVNCLIGLGFFEAAYGIIQYLSGWQYIFFYRKQAYTLEGTGTYINRNHYAGLLEMILPFVLAGILYRVGLHEAGQRAYWRRLVASKDFPDVLRNLAILSTILIGLIFSLSRMGMAASAVGLLLTGAIVFSQGHRSTLAIAVLVVTIAAGYAYWIGLGPVLERFAGKEGALEWDRLPIWRDTLRLIRDFPMTGTGLGTFPHAIFHYQTYQLALQYEHAHNDYLEVAGELGIPAAVLFWGSLWVLLVKLVRAIPRLPRTSERILATGCGGALAAFLMHSLADFNLEIPANALVLSWICGSSLALLQNASRKKSARESLRHQTVTIIPQ